VDMFGHIMGQKMFVVTCKGCARDVPAQITDFPFQSIAVTCPQCNEKRQYRPSEVFQGKPSLPPNKQGTSPAERHD